MYGHFIYFIVALLVLSLYGPVESPRFTLLQASILFFGIIALFVLYTRAIFNHLAAGVRQLSIHDPDQVFSRINTRQSILALILFAVNIWGLNLPTFLKKIPLFQALPTLSDLFFLCIFICYLIIIWNYGFSAQKAIGSIGISRGSYIYSNLAFSIPILIPYALLSGIMDILLLLPFELPRRILITSIGQTGYFLLFLLIAALFAPLLVMRFWRCSPLEDGVDRRRIEDLCKKSGVTYADIVYWPIFGGRMITAGVMGLVGRFRYILVTKALLQLLRPEEIDQVIAHEIGHVKRKHLVLYLFFFIGFMLISYIVTIVTSYLIFNNTFFLKMVLEWNFDPETVFRTFSSVLLLVCVILYFRFLFGYFMRNFERQADGYVFRLFPNAHPLINTFSKIVSSSGQSADKPNWHHFSIRQRVEHLIKCEASPENIIRHDRKMRRSLIVYFVSLVFLAYAVFQFNQFVDSRSNREVTLINLETYLNHKQSKTAQDALLYLMIGNIYFEQQQIDKAVTAYDSGLELAPNHPEILNNLAWLLATSTDTEFYDPIRALDLAQKAINLQKAPHIWDTLAESFFINGYITEAIQSERNALAMASDDRSIYESQLEKFEKALKLKNATE